MQFILVAVLIYCFLLSLCFYIAFIVDMVCRCVECIDARKERRRKRIAVHPTIIITVPNASEIITSSFVRNAVMVETRRVEVVV